MYPGLSSIRRIVHTQYLYDHDHVVKLQIPCFPLVWLTLNRLIGSGIPELGITSLPPSRLLGRSIAELVVSGLVGSLVR